MYDTFLQTLSINSLKVSIVVMTITVITIAVANSGFSVRMSVDKMSM